MSYSSAVVVFLLPPTEEGRLIRHLIVLIGFLSALTLEVTRKKTNRPFLGLRTYEKENISGFMWAAAGISAALLSVDIGIPPFIPAGLILGMAFIDPLMGELRFSFPGLYPYIPVFAHMTLFFFTAVLFGEDTTSPLILFIVFFCSISAVLSEYPQIKGIDDNFLMIAVPLIVSSLILWMW